MNKMEINIPVKNVTLPAILSIPESAVGLIIFSHGSGSSRLSPRNNMVAAKLRDNNYATLLFDLLTMEEDKNYEMRFNISLLTQRLMEVTKWVSTNEMTKHLPIGYFGASTGAASALSAAAQMTDVVKGVVSRGGRPDMADEFLPLVKAASLLIIGGRDLQVIELNKKAFEKMNCEKIISIVNGADHLFTQAGKLDEVAALAIQWFDTHLKSQSI